ncbi:hypothetical protein DICVIV_00153 [Dictyocaulus viviparus]|uniref:Uncharacterized protein n=1 Tax=Dictyocaulus viviparus TaxID=29172 RepID=A0A0D8YCG1_DICVI|nr:hypothetical protein DICVIV_00153 [Dictyocaulus viviparus]
MTVVLVEEKMFIHLDSILVKSRQHESFAYYNNQYSQHTTLYCVAAGLFLLSEKVNEQSANRRREHYGNYGLNSCHVYSNAIDKRN